MELKNKLQEKKILTKKLRDKFYSDRIFGANPSIVITNVLKKL